MELLAPNRVVPMPSKQSSANLPEDPKKIIRTLGLKVTTQRLSILQILQKCRTHFTTQDINDVIAKDFPGIGFATVYRFLRELANHGFLSEVRMGGLPARYEWSSKVHHDHLSCTNCGKIVEFENTEIERLQEQVAQSLGFVLTGHVLELFGTCVHCTSRTPVK
jgi:Fur family transcriptional regulator, ferric uptake regulator